MHGGLVIWPLDEAGKYTSLPRGLSLITKLELN